jgi:16S rRNA (guanine527-N7)-methyltransferase
MQRGQNAPADQSGAQELLKRYIELVQASPHNLMSKQGLDELATRHVPESVRFAIALPSGGRLLDLGSGGGLPGMVVAIVRPDVEVHLLEATGKKVQFLAETAATLGIKVEVHHGRAEQLSETVLRGGFDLVTARAVARLDRLVVWGEPFMRPDGILLAIKGERWQEELADASTILASQGLEAYSTPDRDPLTGPEGPLVVALRRRPAVPRARPGSEETGAGRAH